MQFLVNLSLKFEVAVIILCFLAKKCIIGAKYYIYLFFYSARLYPRNTRLILRKAVVKFYSSCVTARNSLLQNIQRFVAATLTVLFLYFVGVWVEKIFHLTSSLLYRQIDAGLQTNRLFRLLYKYYTQMDVGLQKNRLLGLIQILFLLNFTNWKFNYYDRHTSIGSKNSDTSLNLCVADGILIKQFHFGWSQGSQGDGI